MHMMIYIALVALIIMYTMQWAVTAMAQHRPGMQKNNLIMTIACASDVLVRDLRNAYNREIHYDKQGRWIWQGDATCIAWYVKDNQLFRAEGSYSNTVWHEHTHSLMVEGIEMLRIDDHHGNVRALITAVNTNVEAAGYICTRIVCARNGSIHA
jgi:hypothetical protein